MLAIQDKELETAGRLYVPYNPLLRRGVENAMADWKSFTALPDAQKVLFGYSPDAKTSGNGYELKLEGSIDRKEDCHLRVNAREVLLEDAAKADPVIGPQFVESALALNELMASTVQQIAEEIAPYCGGNFVEDVMGYQPRWLLRFLHYFGDRGSGEVIAAPHVDKGGFTLHLYESHPGVEYFDYTDQTWKPLPLAHDETVFFPGLGLQQRTRCRLRALAHRVVATEETAQTGRYSAVCFFNFGHARFFNKPAFGSTQALIEKNGPDFFYDMPFEEFDRYFID